jgi:hypothetical protein
MKNMKVVVDEYSNQLKTQALIVTIINLTG